MFELKDVTRMARTAAAGFWSQVRAALRTRSLWRRRASRLAVLILIAVLASPRLCLAEPVKAEATFTSAGGFARLVLKFSEDVGSEVTTAGSIIVIRFERPVDISVDRFADAVPDYVGSVRRDPDGMAIRLSLARRVTVNTMTAGERLFVDFLPDSWSGPPPNLPQEVVRELAERARIAERELRQQRALLEASKRPPVKVHASVQPTFVRFVFEMPEGVGVSSVLNDQKLKLVFSRLLVFDLTDAKLAAPPNVASIEQKAEGEASTIEISLVGDVDVHSFREDKNYVIDVAFQQSEKTSMRPNLADALRAPKKAAETRAPQAAVAMPSAAMPSAAMPSAATPAGAVPAAPTADVPGQPASSAPAMTPAALPDNPPVAAEQRQTGEAAPAASQTPARQAETVTNPEQVPKKPQATEAQTSAPPSPNEPAAAAAEVPAKVLPSPAPLPEERSGVSLAPLTASRDSDGLHLTFSFPVPTPAALFRRADTLWLIFNSKKPIGVEKIRGQVGAVIADVGVLPLEKGQAIRIPQSTAIARACQRGSAGRHDLDAHHRRYGADADTTARGDTKYRRAVACQCHRTAPQGRPASSVRRPGRRRHLDRGYGAAAGPRARQAAGFRRGVLAQSIHGVAIRPNSDDVTADVAPDKIILGKPGGLTLSPADTGAERAPTAVRPIFDLGEWRRNQEGSFNGRQDALIEAAGAAAPDQRTRARIDLARFYMSRGLFPEAAGVLELALADAKPGSEDPTALIVHAVASILMGRPERGLKDLASPAIGTNFNSQLWKAVASARMGKWPDAREKFKSIEFAISSLPLELQRIVIADAMRASLEVKDYRRGGQSAPANWM